MQVRFRALFILALIAIKGIVFVPQARADKFWQNTKMPYAEAYKVLEIHNAEDFIEFFNPNRSIEFVEKGHNPKLEQKIAENLFYMMRARRHLSLFFGYQPTAAQMRRLLEIPTLFSGERLHEGASGSIVFTTMVLVGGMAFDCVKSVDDWIELSNFKVHSTAEFQRLKKYFFSKYEKKVFEFDLSLKDIVRLTDANAKFIEQVGGSYMRILRVYREHLMPKALNPETVSLNEQALKTVELLKMPSHYWFLLTGYDETWKAKDFSQRHLFARQFLARMLVQVLSGGADLELDLAGVKQLRKALYRTKYDLKVSPTHQGSQTFKVQVKPKSFFRNCYELLVKPKD